MGRRGALPGCRPSRSAVLALVALAGFGLLALLFFWQLFAGGADRMMIGAPDGDFLRQFYPYRVFVARTWAMGRLPTWNPHQYGGTPAWADPQQAVAYPWRALQVPLALGARTLPLWAVELEAVAHVALAGWLMLLLARSLGAGWAGAWLAGVAFAFGGFLTGYPVEQLAVLDTAVWIAPALLGLTLALDAAGRGDRQAERRGTVLAGVGTALTGLAGHPQTAVYGAYVCLAWLVYRWRWARLPVRRLVAIGLGWAVLAAGLAAVQWLPSAQLLANSDRSVPAGEVSAGLSPSDLPQVLVAPPPKRAEADPDSLTATDIVWAPLFVGCLVLLLAAWGVRNAPATRFWSVSALVALGLSLGGSGPLLPAIRYLPGLALFRHPERFAVLFAVGMALAAGLAFDALLRRGEDVRGPGRAALAVAGVLAVAAAYLTLSGQASAQPSADGLTLAALFGGAGGLLLVARASRRLSSRGLAGGLVLLVTLELFSAGRGRALTPYRNVFEPDAIVDALQPLAKGGRVSSEALLPGGANAASVYGLYDVTGDMALRPASVARMAALPEMVQWRLLDVRYVVTERTFEPGAPLKELVRVGDRALYEVQLNVLPAWVPASWQESSLVNGSWHPAAAFDPLAECPVPGSVTQSGIEMGRSSGTAALTGLDPVGATVTAHLDTPGFLVLSALDVSHETPGQELLSGWSARARPATASGGAAAGATPGGPLLGSTHAFAVVSAYDGLLPAMALPAGDWTAAFTYAPLGLHLGLALAGAALLLGAVLWRPSLARHS